MAIRILHLEEDAAFSAVVQAVLAAGGMEVRLRRVGSAGDFRASLDAQDWDLILASHGQSANAGLSALEAARRRHSTIPFVFLAPWDDEVAAGCLGAGAADFVARSDLDRLAFVVDRSVRAGREMEALRAARDQAVLGAKAVAEEAARAKEAFTAKVGREIRAPLNDVVSRADLLAETALDAKQRQYLEVIRASAAILARSIEDNLDRRRGESGQLRLEKRPFDVREEARDVDMRILLRLRVLGAKESPETFRNLILGFLQDAAAKLAELREGALAPGFRALALAAHGFKGMSLNFGALALARECEALQVAAEQERAGELPRILERLAAAEARTRAVLEEMVASDTNPVADGRSGDG